MSQSMPAIAADIIKKQYPDFNPQVGIVLGSGLGDFTKQLKNTQVIPYETLPGFPEPSVKGHAGEVILGELNAKPVVCLKGRAHSYESLDYTPVKNYIRTLKLLGCDVFIATNASGSLRMEVAPGELVCVSDHINFQPGNPLAGPNDDEFGTRFPPMDDAYDPELRTLLHQTADELSIDLHDGVYMSVLGPMYETAAEIRAYKVLGADLIGMSTVPEVIVARHCGLRTAVVASITNYATGLAQESHDHNNVLEVAQRAAGNLVRLIESFIGKLP